jgi:ribosomal protein S6--L-glutamate ligase
LNPSSRARIGILASEGSWYYRDLQRAATRLGHLCERLDFERLISALGNDSQSTRGMVPTDDSVRRRRRAALWDWREVDLSSHDLILVRTMPAGSLEQVVYRMDVLSRLEASGVRVVNTPKSLECAIDKYLTTARLQAAGLPVPKTIVCENEDDAMSAFQQLNQDVVVKPLFGSEGRGIVRVTDPDLAHRTFRTLMRLKAVLYLQQFIDHPGCDVRVVVMGDRVLGGMRRTSKLDFRTNVARDAVAEPHQPNAMEIDLALRAARATGTFISGVDLLYDRDGRCYVIEVNAVPGWQAFARVTGIDVASRLISACTTDRNR